MFGNLKVIRSLRLKGSKMNLSFISLYPAFPPLHVVDFIKRPHACGDLLDTMLKP